MTPDKNGWIAGIESAPKDDGIFVFIPFVDEDGEQVYDHSMAWYLAEEGRWDGEWRYTDIAALATAEPTHWKPLDTPEDYAAKVAA